MVLGALVPGRNGLKMEKKVDRLWWIQLTGKRELACVRHSSAGLQKQLST